MTGTEAVQLALDGLAPRRRRPRAPAEHTPAGRDPIARVVLDVQATHLGQTFDYLIDEKQSDAARPGMLVRVRFGGRRVNGVIWERAATSGTPASSLRYLERVLGDDVLVPASMRRDITLIADAYGGTRANILRLAVPPRVAKAEKEQRLVAGFTRDREPGARVLERFERLSGMYGRGLADLRDALHTRGAAFRSFVVDPLPGVGRRASMLAWMAGESLEAGRGAVIVLPGMKETRDVLDSLGALGFTPFGPERSGTGGWRGDVAVLSAETPPVDRYRAWIAVATGQVRCVIGPRAAMYAPIEGPGLFAIMDDAAYQQADGMMPYAHARGVLRLRAKAHGGVFVALADARSPLSQMEVAGLPGTGGAPRGPFVEGMPGSGITGSASSPDTGPSSMTMPGARGIAPLAPSGLSDAVSGPSVAIRPLPSVLKDAMPWVRWLNREELARLADPSIGARVPHTAVANIRAALDAGGPVLFSIPADGVAEALSCANPKCRRQARCRKCAGPLQRLRGVAVPRCRWCGAAASNWTCPHCHGDRLRVIRVGAAGTADELRGLFRGVPVLLSSPSQQRGVIGEIDHRPVIVIATPGAEPRVRMRAGGGMAPTGPAGPETAGDALNAAGGAGYGSYAAVAILDAWTSLYAPGLDARIDTLAAWMRVVSLCAPRTEGGQALLLGETDPVIAHSLMLWDSSLLASHELEERVETGMPPAVAVACVWGRRDTVMRALKAVGALDGDMAVCPVPGAAVAGAAVAGAMGDGAAGDGAPAPAGDAALGGGPSGNGVQVPSSFAGMPASMPAVLGPVPIAQPRTVDARELEVTADRVRAVVRVPHSRREELAARLKNEVARHVAAREPGELRFQMDRKDLI